MDEALKQGLHLHRPLMGKIMEHVHSEEEYLSIARRTDDLIAAVVVETLERCRTSELREQEIQKIRKKFESRWLAHARVKK